MKHGSSPCQSGTGYRYNALPACWIPSEGRDPQHFKETVTRALTKIEQKEEVEKPTMDDQNRTFRTRLVAFWMLSNAALAVAIENLNGLPSSNEEQNEDDLRKKQNTYFAVILYSTFALAAVRFAGVCLFKQVHKHTY